MDQPIQRVRSAIEDITGAGRANGRGGYLLRCPAHSDRNPSLCLDANADHHALLHCQAGCDLDAVLEAAGLTRRDLYPEGSSKNTGDPWVATYRYTDEQGNLLYEVQRSVAKRFRQRRPDPDHPGRHLYNLQGVRRVLYRLAMVADAIEQGLPVYLVEGEKDVHSIEARSRVATCNPGGAGKWRPEYTEALRGAHVYIVTDRDEVGLRHARGVQAALLGAAATVTLLQPKAGKDVTDHLVAGFELDELEFVPAEIATPVSPALVGQAEPVSGAPETAPDSGRQIRVTPATAFEIEVVDWMWDGRMPLGEICLIGGREGVGKSTFLAWLAAKITRGQLPGIYQGQPRAVLYAASEDAWGYTIAPRMIAAGADLNLVYRIHVEDGGIPGGLNLPLDCQELPRIAEERKAAALMCDPILSMVNDTLNVNRAQELRRALEPLRRAAEAGGFAVPALIHFNKTAESDANSRIAGSRAWAEVARAVMMIAHDEQDDQRYTCVVTQTKNNLGRSNLPSLAYTIIDAVVEATDGRDAHVGRLVELGETSATAVEILSRKPTNGRSSIADQILAVLADSDRAMSPRDIREALEGAPSDGSVRQALLRLRRTVRVETIAGGTLYRPVTSDGE